MTENLFCEETMRKARGFTLVEILIVVAIVAVLAGLALSAFASARESGRQTTCTSQLRQIGLAFSMYWQDNNGRPPELYTLVDTGHLSTPALLVCPSDPWGNLAGLDYDHSTRVGYPECPPYKHPTSYFYFESFSSLHLQPNRNPRVWWDRLTEQMQSAAGVAACKVHGEATGERRNEPGTWSFQGKILRLQRDGAVVVRKAYPKVTYVPGTDQLSEVGWSYWNLFSDNPEPFSDRPRP